VNPAYRACGLCWCLVSVQDLQRHADYHGSESWHDRADAEEGKQPEIDLTNEQALRIAADLARADATEPPPEMSRSDRVDREIWDRTWEQP
jgi:hypothetical protein